MERQNIEFRWEVYNVPNSFRPMPPNNSAAETALAGDVTNRLFGQLRTSDRPRIMQFALKYVF